MQAGNWPASCVQRSIGDFVMERSTTVFDVRLTAVSATLWSDGRCACVCASLLLSVVVAVVALTCRCRCDVVSSTSRSELNPPTLSAQINRPLLFRWCAATWCGLKTSSSNSNRRPKTHLKINPPTRVSTRVWTLPVSPLPVSPHRMSRKESTKWQGISDGRTVKHVVLQ